MRFFLLGWITLLAALPVNATPVGRELPDFAALDQHGRQQQLSRTEAKVVVLFFTSNGCPIARQCIPELVSLQNEFLEAGLRIWFVNANTGDTREAVAREAMEFKGGWLPVLLDETQGLASLLEIKRTGTAVAIETKTRKVFYAGAIDDRLVEGAQKPKASVYYLKDALRSFFDGKEIATRETTARGCLLTIGPKEPPSYSKDIAPLLQQKCFGCHSPGNIGTPKLASYKQVSGNADMIQEVLLARRMPPWQPDRHFGHFQNDHSLTVEETRTVLRWIEQGAARGDGPDPLEGANAPVQSWSLGEPDAVVALPKVEEIPATGILDYRHREVSAPFASDVWVRGVSVKPDNRRVVHHVIVRVKEAGKEPDIMNDAFLVGWAPGTPEMFFPEGTGKLIKKGSVLDFEMHYTTSGREEKDQSRIGIYLHKEKPPMRLKTHAAYNLDFEVVPNAAEQNAVATYVFRKEGYLFEMSPHMHMRGKWFKFEALYPTGEREVLLSVPDYDFKWQHTYRLSTPKKMPAGTWIFCSGGFDNSPRKPGNPNPNIPVHFGEQSFDEMFIGFMGVANVPQSESKPVAQK